jgi:hypothetical protein
MAAFITRSFKKKEFVSAVASDTGQAWRGQTEPVATLLGRPSILAQPPACGVRGVTASMLRKLC